MRFNFRKISALASSALMIGMTAGIAAARRAHHHITTVKGYEVCEVIQNKVVYFQ